MWNPYVDHGGLELTEIHLTLTFNTRTFNTRIKGTSYQLQIFFLKTGLHTVQLASCYVTEVNLNPRFSFIYLQSAGFKGKLHHAWLMLLSQGCLFSTHFSFGPLPSPSPRAQSLEAGDRQSLRYWNGTQLAIEGLNGMWRTEGEADQGLDGKAGCGDRQWRRNTQLGVLRRKSQENGTGPYSFFYTSIGASAAKNLMRGRGGVTNGSAVKKTCSYR